EFVEASQRRQLARRRALGVILPVEISEEFADGHRLALDLLFIKGLHRDPRWRGADNAIGSDHAAEELAELNQVGAVTLDGVITEVPLQFQIVQKLADKG